MDETLAEYEDLDFLLQIVRTAPLVVAAFDSEPLGERPNPLPRRSVYRTPAIVLLRSRGMFGSAHSGPRSVRSWNTRRT